jgi:hypothetical protein
MIFTETFLAALASDLNVDVLVSVRADVESGCETELEIKIARTDVRVRLSDLDEPTGREILRWVSAREEQVQDVLVARASEPCADRYYDEYRFAQDAGERKGSA